MRTLILAEDTIIIISVDNNFYTEIPISMPKEKLEELKNALKKAGFVYKIARVKTKRDIKIYIYVVDPESKDKWKLKFLEIVDTLILLSMKAGQQ